VRIAFFTNGYFKKKGKLHDLLAIPLLFRKGVATVLTWKTDAEGFHFAKKGAPVHSKNFGCRRSIPAGLRNGLFNQHAFGFCHPGLPMC
jgi:hypothetical protein